LSSTKKQQLRLRVFAGPNGSGKSTVIKKVKNYKVNGRPIDFGFYINADDIAVILNRESFRFDKFEFTTTNKEFKSIVLASGLINDEFTEEEFVKSYTLRSNQIRLKKTDNGERIAQIIADFLRKKLLALKKRFSFETVFSHPSKLEIMKKAVDAGYKVYLYFVSTESADINKFRVAARKKKGGHDVPEDKIASRYLRSMDLLHEACQLSYQVFFFDNSDDGEETANMFAHYKIVKGKKEWDIDKGGVPQWFFKYYIAKFATPR
jgi:predicted ABC-type ATPase